MLRGLPTAHQGQLIKQVYSLFPNEHIHVDSRKQSNYKYPSESLLELDIWIPKLQLAFEFQDPYHYVTVWYSQKNVSDVKANDEMKRMVVQESGVTLLEVPCWWDGEKESLKSSVQFQRPDLIGDAITVPPIPLNPPFQFFSRRELLGVGELMLATFPANPDLFSASTSSRSWWMGEKYDGVRCCWNPDANVMHMKGIIVPRLFTSNLPNTFIDGEIWCGRGRFNFAFMFVTGSQPIEMGAIRMVCFDLPAIKYQSHFFEDRYKELLDTINHEHPFCVVSRSLCMGSENLTAFTKGVIEHGGEGVILRHINSLYTHGKTSQLIKFKAAYGDKEGLVVGVSEAGIMLELPSGQTFTVPPHNVHVVPFPYDGDIVSFSFKIDSRKELPVDPEIIRVRNDVSWQDVISSQSSDINDCSLTREFKTHSWGHWSFENMKSFMESLAKRFKLDPRNPDTWYKMPLKSLFQLKNVRTIIGKFGSYYKALTTLFPDIGLEQFAMSRTNWSQVENRRKFFEDYAESNHFDHVDPNSWYLQPSSKIMAYKGAATVMSYHNNSIPNALMELFPEIGMQLSVWNQLEDRRCFFIEYAEAHKFDPNSSEAWRAHAEDFTQDQNARFVMAHYGGSLFAALRDIFPDMINQKGHRKQFFEDFAKENQFNHLNLEDWNSYTSAIRSHKHASVVLAFHSNSLLKALRDLFGEVDWGNSRRFQKIFWADALNRRSFFESFAHEYDFDLLLASNWESYYKTVTHTKNAHSVLSHHRGSINKALKDLFPEIDWNKSTDSHTFHEPTYRRKFFEDFAKANNFDPLVPSLWLPWLDSIPNMKTAKTILSYYGGSVNKALRDLFSESQWGKSPQFYQKLYKHTLNRRSFFEDFAKGKGFDPLHPDQWYPHMRNLKSTKNVNSVLVYHEGKASKALIDLFPEVDWQKSSLIRRINIFAEALWSDTKRRRRFFEQYARKQNFNPLEYTNWSSHLKSIPTVRNATSVLHYHKGSVTKALRDLFPELQKQRNTV